MLIRSSDTGFDHTTASEITPRSVLESRRTWLQQMALGAIFVVPAWLVLRLVNVGASKR